jgi:hypothetical protein
VARCGGMDPGGGLGFALVVPALSRDPKPPLLMFLGIAARASRNITSGGYGPRLEAGATRVFVAMTARNTSALAARGARGLRELSRLERGRGECRMRAAPAVPCANWIEKTHTSIQVQRRASDIPCAMALRLIRALLGDEFVLSPSLAN